MSPPISNNQPEFHVFLHLRVLFFCCSPNDHFKKNILPEDISFQRVSGVSFVVIWERSGALGCFCEAVRWAPFTATSQGGIHEARFVTFCCLKNPSRFRLRRMKERKKEKEKQETWRTGLSVGNAAMGMSLAMNLWCVWIQQTCGDLQCLGVWVHSFD